MQVGVAVAFGVLFGAGVEDGHFRAFDSRDGRVLFEHELPFFTLAVPVAYSIDGKQFVVVAADGRSRMHTRFDERANAPLGGALVAFSLPV